MNKIFSVLYTKIGGARSVTVIVVGNRLDSLSLDLK